MLITFTKIKNTKEFIKISTHFQRVDQDVTSVMDDAQKYFRR